MTDEINKSAEWSVYKSPNRDRVVITAIMRDGEGFSWTIDYPSARKFFLRGFIHLFPSLLDQVGLALSAKAREALVEGVTHLPEENENDT